MTRGFTLISIVLLCLLAACSAAPSSTDNTGDSAVSTLPASVVSGAKINLNTASDADFLAAIPGLGNRMVREFMEYRPYISIQQFRREIGKYVDDTQVAEYEKFVFVPIAINDSDAETLQEIPGLSAEEAASLMAARPFGSAEDFLSKLSEYVTAEELEVAKTYLGEN